MEEHHVLKINHDRYDHLLLDLSKITDIGSPYTRRSFSPKYTEGRKWLWEKMKNLGLNVYFDSAGNLIGKRKGKIGEKTIKNTIAIGSHTDTVPNGGRYDGIAVVIAGLECVATLNDLDIELYHDLEIIDFLAEEPSEWGISCVGSRGISGFLSQSLLATEHPFTKESLNSAITRMGGDPKSLKKADHIKVFFELHIEQGKVLETKKMNIGIVNSIVGITRIQIEFTGSPNHAGTTPMDLRQDAGVSAAELIVEANHLAHDFSQEKNKYFVATSGQIFFEPNASNVVCGESKIIFDIRSSHKNLVELYKEKLLAKAQEISKKNKVKIKNFEILTDTAPVHCDESLINIIKKSCDKNSLSSLVMASGAGHDAAFMSHIAPIAMLFVPSKGGVSHSPEEYTSKKELALGTNILFETMIEYDLIHSK